MKKMFSFALLLLLITSCKKENSGTDNGEVWIRIENKAGITLENASIANTPYGTITNGQLTEYKKMSEPVFATVCDFTLNGQNLYAGELVCWTPPPPPMKGGYYTFKVLPFADYYYPIKVKKK